MDRLGWFGRWRRRRRSPWGAPNCDLAFMTGAGDGGHYPALLPAMSTRRGPCCAAVFRQERPYTPAVRLLFIAAILLAAACEAGPPPATPPITPGSSGSPREVNLIARDYSFQPPTLDLAPGETVVLHVINGGLVTHEAIIGDDRVQDAWEVGRGTARRPAARPDARGQRPTGRCRRPDRGPFGRARRPRSGRSRRTRPPPRGSSGATSLDTGTRACRFRCAGSYRTGRRAPPGRQRRPRGPVVRSRSRTGLGLDQQASRRNA